MRATASTPIYAHVVTKRARSQRGDGPVSASVYWWLFRLSPLIMLVGMAAGGVLIVRSILVWGVEGNDYPFAIDIPIAAAVLLLWAGAAALLLMPPESVLARRAGANSPAVLVWPLGKRFRLWTVISAPICGLLAAIAPFPIPVALGWDPDIPANLWPGLPLAIGITLFAGALIWIVLRGALHGVELTPTHLIARGYFVTRRYKRDEIVSINAVQLKWWPFLVLTMLMNRDVEHTLQLSLDSGSEPLLFAANSHEHDVEIGADMVRTWREGLEEY